MKGKLPDGAVGRESRALLLRKAWDRGSKELVSWCLQEGREGPGRSFSQKHPAPLSWGLPAPAHDALREPLGL